MRSSLLPLLALLPGLALASPENLLAIHNPVQTIAGTELKFEASAFAGNDLYAAHRLADEWASPPDTRPGRNLAVGHARAELSAQYGGFSVSSFKRFDGFGTATRDAVNFYYGSQQPDSLLARPGTLDLRYGFTGFSASGVRLGWSGQVQEKLRVGFSLNLMKAGILRQERIKGTATVSGGVGTVAGTRTLLYTGLDYTPAAEANINDFSPYAQSTTDKGQGRSLDLGMQWDLRPDLHLTLIANDLLGQLSWKQVPELTQNFNDANWPLEFNVPGSTAKITGTNRYRDYTLHLKPKLSSSLRWDAADTWGVDGGFATRAGVCLPEAGAFWRWADAGIARLSYEPRFGSLGLGLGYGPFFVEGRTDRTNLNNAHTVGLQAGVALRF